MEAMLQTFIENIKDLVQSSNIFLSIFLGLAIVVLESIIPMLPLALFIAINMIAFGNFLGFIISWIGTIIGCSLSFYIFRKIRPILLKKLKNDSKLKNFMMKIGNIDFSKLVIILSIPFTPAFSINISAGLSNMSYKKYLFALIISKIFLIYFWGFVGTTLMESITDIDVLIKLGFLILIAFLLSKIVIKKFNIK
ncbi:MAG: VTT domain-containing protein [Bacilli bacterium]|nr:VTT domain-containing protein [Bacilli bacterium]